MKNDVIECLQATKNILIKEGWTKNTILNSKGERCLSGAVIKNSNYVTSKHVLAEIEETIGERNIPKWNDAPERTLEEVLDLIDKTIERLKTK